MTTTTGKLQSVQVSVSNGSLVLSNANPNRGARLQHSSILLTLGLHLLCMETEYILTEDSKLC